MAAPPDTTEGPDRPDIGPAAVHHGLGTDEDMGKINNTARQTSGQPPPRVIILRLQMPRSWPCLVALSGVATCLGILTLNPLFWIPGCIGNITALVWYNRRWRRVQFAADQLRKGHRTP